MSLRTKPRAAMVHTRRLLRPARTYVDWISSRRDGADLSVFHEYVPPPSGGGHQFIRALSRELARRGLTLESNRISREERVQVRDDRVQARQDQRAARQAERRASRVPVVSNTPRPGTQPPPPTEVRHSPAVHWNTDWRHNSRYNWYNWRHRHRSLFTLGAYYDPFGWGYQPYSIGWRMWPSYYRSSYWLNDPWQYRLPYAPPGTQWVRYYNDVLLVDMYTGEVIDVVYDFFW